jgi:23S rRNA pseudouridine1911/1915/1917 synthase
MNLAQRSTKSSIEVLYQDPYTMIVNKPSGLVVTPTPLKEKKTVESLVNNEFLFSNGGRLHPCHRLDRDTSGVLIFARGKRNQQLWMGVFRNRLIEKQYIVFVQGIMKKTKGALKGWIKDLDARKYQEKSKAQWAECVYEVMGYGDGFSVLKINLLTGRTNQIRIQLSEIGHPVLGERKYAFAKDYPLRFRRVALHAQSVECYHPVLKNKLYIEAELPSDMKSFLE